VKTRTDSDGLLKNILLTQQEGQQTEIDANA